LKCQNSDTHPHALPVVLPLKECPPNFAILILIAEESQSERASEGSDLDGRRTI
jgi:hypothetical protein